MASQDINNKTKAYPKDKSGYRNLLTKSEDPAMNYQGQFLLKSQLYHQLRNLLSPNDKLRQDGFKQ